MRSGRTSYDKAGRKRVPLAEMSVLTLDAEGVTAYDTSINTRDRFTAYSFG